MPKVIVSLFSKISILLFKNAVFFQILSFKSKTVMDCKGSNLM